MSLEQGFPAYEYTGAATQTTSVAVGPRLFGFNAFLCEINAHFVVAILRPQLQTPAL